MKQNTFRDCHREKVSLLLGSVLLLIPACVAQQTSGMSLSPAVIMVKAKPGQSLSQDLTLSNNTPLELQFRLEARDVVVRDGRRILVPAGEVEGSIARFATFTDREILVSPGSSVTTAVTITLPYDPGPRAVACIFVGKTVLGSSQGLAMTGSLGALVTFTLADDFRVESQPLKVEADADSQWILFRQGLRNVGTDPVVPKGVIAVTDEKGALVARLPVESQRLLPGEMLELTAEHLGLLKSGKYRVRCLMENESSFFANVTEFNIK